MASFLRSAVSDLRKAFKAVAGQTRYQLLKLMLRSGSSYWPTKSLDIWLLMQLVYYRLNLGDIVEIGSGRSSSYLIECARWSLSKFISIEENPAYVKRINLGLKSINATTEAPVMHIPLRGDWFDESLFWEALGKFGISSPSFILVDAPEGFSTSQSRVSDTANRNLRKLCAQADCVVIDDMQWSPVRDAVPLILDLRNWHCRMAEYKVYDNVNQIAFYVRTDNAQELDSVFAMLNLLA